MGLLVCGADGRIRLWSKDSGGIRRQGGMPCFGVRPTKCLIAADGNLVVATGARGDDVACGGETRPGGMFFYDLRKVSGDEFSSAALVGEYISPPGPQEGAFDLALTTDTSPSGDEEAIAMAVLDGKIQAFNLQSLGATGSKPLPQYSFDVVSRFEDADAACRPSAIACSGRHAFVATTAPSVGIWRRTFADEQYGHSEYVRAEPLAPMVLMTKLRPLKQKQIIAGSVPGVVLAHVQDSLEKDRIRLAGFTDNPSLTIMQALTNYPGSSNREAISAALA